MHALSGNEPRRESFIEALDARTKMFICLLCSVVVIFLKDVYSLSLLLSASFIYVMLLKKTRVLLIAYGAVAVMALVAFLCVQVLSIFMPQILSKGYGMVLNPFLRVIILVNVILAMALSSRIQEILTALKSLRLPLFLYLPAVVMIRFIPGFINDIKQVSEALKIRGYKINPASLTFRPLLTLRLVFVPVVIRALRSSDELAVAAELKGLGSAASMTFFKRKNLVFRDYCTGAFALFLLAAAVFLQYRNIFTTA